MSLEANRTIHIVNAVKKHECLWNVNSSDYNKRDKIEKAWTEVSQEVGKSDVYCRDKWRNVRTGFLRSVQHQIRKSSAEEVPSDFYTVKRKRFYLHDQMAFLLPSAECLEIARKKRKQTQNYKADIDNFNIKEYYDSSSAHSFVDKHEHVDDSEPNANGDGEYEEHHSLENVNIPYDNSQVLCEPLNKSETVQGTVTVHDIPPARDSYNNKNVALSPITKRVMHIIGSQFYDNNSKQNTQETTCKVSTSTNDRLYSRDEEQLLYFFRSCLDDVLTLDKRKQTVFKRRMIDLLDELHNSH